MIVYIVDKAAVVAIHALYEQKAVLEPVVSVGNCIEFELQERPYSLKLIGSDTARGRRSL